MRLGSFSWLTLALFYVKLNLFVDINGMEIIPAQVKLAFDTDNFDKIRWAINWYINTVQIKITTEVDVN